MSSTRMLIWFFVVVMVVLSVFLRSVLTDSDDADGAMPETLAEAPDLHMENATITQFRADGSLKYELGSSQIRHFEDDQMTRLLAPELFLYSPEEPPWQLNSERGYIRKREDLTGRTEEVVYLRDGVVVEQKQADGRFVRLKSRSIYLYPDTQKAETTQSVMIDTEVGRTTAVGLQGDLQKGLLHLSSSPEQRVHTIVLRRQFK